MKGIRHPLNVNWFRWEDVISMFIVNTVAIVLCKAQTLRWFEGLYIIPKRVFFPGSLQRVTSVFISHLPVWLNANVADLLCYIYMSFWYICCYRLVVVRSIDFWSWWWGECLKPVFVEKRAWIDTLTLRYLGNFLLIAADLLTGLSVLPICV